MLIINKPRLPPIHLNRPTAAFEPDSAAPRLVLRLQWACFGGLVGCLGLLMIKFSWYLVLQSPFCRSRRKLLANPPYLHTAARPALCTCCGLQHILHLTSLSLNRASPAARTRARGGGECGVTWRGQCGQQCHARRNNSELRSSARQPSYHARITHGGEARAGRGREGGLSSQSSDLLRRQFLLCVSHHRHRRHRTWLDRSSSFMKDYLLHDRAYVITGDYRNIAQIFS